MTFTIDDNEVEDSFNLIIMNNNNNNYNNNNNNNNVVWSVPWLRRCVVNLQLSGQLISG